MADADDLLISLRSSIRDLQDFVRTMKSTSLKPPMPSVVYYTTQSVRARVVDLLEAMGRVAIDLEQGIDEIMSELEEYQSKE